MAKFRWSVDRWCRVAVVMEFAAWASVVTASPTPDQLAFFESKIRPVLAQHCYQCHSAEALQAGKLKANLLVDSRDGMMKGGESGAAVVPGSATTACCSRRSSTTASRCPRPANSPTT
jgi:hypothetical protein